jgi:dipeptidyl aminopeptidase/acylaminoacyl peptidase
MLYEALQKNGVQSYFTLVSNAGHGPGLHEEIYFKTMIDFLNNASKKD